MPQRAISSSYVPKTYADLLRCVKQTMIVGQQEIDEAWVRTYHETGRLIVCHILLSKRADYGAQVYRGLARDTGASERKLYECAQFYRHFPILRGLAKLGWNGCRLLCQVGDDAQRQALAGEAMKRAWDSGEIERRVRALNAALEAAAAGANGNGAKSSNGDSSRPPPSRLVPKRGRPGLHLVVERGGALVIDLGFKLHRPLTAEQSSRWRKGDIVRLTEERVVRDDHATKSDLFTYAATVRRIVDGDTLVIAIQVAPEVWLEEKLRLRGVDCPEISRAEGGAAKRFTESLLAPGQNIVIHTTKPDKYDRYLADVFIAAKNDVVSGSGAAPEIFLNQALLEHGHAVRKDAWEFGDWGEV